MPSHLVLGRRVCNDHLLQQRTKLLDISIISAHNLNKKFRHTKLYGVVYAYPDDQQPTKRESCSHKFETTWNDQFVVRVDEEFLNSETSTVNISIYAVRNWSRFGRNHLIGSTRIVISTFLNHPLQNVALQIRKPKTLEPVGVLNVTVSLLPSLLPNNDHDAQITSTPHSCSMRFDSKHKIDEDIGCALLEQRRKVDKSGPLDEMREQEQIERKNVKSKIEQWKHDLSPDEPSTSNRQRRNRSMSQVNLLGSVSRDRGFQFCLCGGGMDFEA